MQSEGIIAMKQTIKIKPNSEENITLILSTQDSKDKVIRKFIKIQ